ncbi:phage holin family protein [Moraxella ovis]|uniref:phage holin family protein n=1 Tax=Moraxella ovis TaxID=29433 RepID=UPI000D9FD87A|nr:phage holin family protein [Moraxella ovis]SPX85322.1 Uncharacterised protein [Moraxella ovis]STZ06374.1 Uncharacterised protein [Moraxella ovis]
MPEKDLTTYTAITYLWVVLLAMAGGLVAFIRRLNRQRKPERLSVVFIKLIGETAVSAFAGVVTFYLCEYLETEPLLTAVAVAISGHLGGNAIDAIGKKINHLFSP